MARQGRDLEILVQIIQQAFAETGFEVCSPAYLVTPGGSRTEIDVSVRGEVGGRKLVFVIACRDRAKREGRVWIRELIGLRSEFLIDGVIAVSTSGFTKPARQLAADQGIVLRSVRDIDVEEAGHILQDVCHSAQVMEYRIELVDVHDVVPDEFGGHAFEVLMDAMGEALDGERTTNEPLFLRPDGKSATLNDVVSGVQLDASCGVRPDDGPVLVRRSVMFVVTGDQFLVETRLGRIPLRRFDVTLRVSVHPWTVPLERVRGYVGGPGAISHTQVFTIPLPGKPQRAEFHELAVSGHRFLTTRPIPEPPKRPPPA